MKRLIPVIVLLTATAGVCAAWSPAGDKIRTRWADEVTPENVWREYPRPQLERRAWANLNGLWEYAVTGRDEGAPGRYDGEIFVPFCIESSLSGVGKEFKPDQKLWYRTGFTVDPQWKGKNIILHFGAVDWACEIWINDKKVGGHKGGFDAFSFDITECLRSSGKQKLVVAVIDPSSEGSQARGKQQFNPGGIWYTPVSGIWQTVWLEPVSKTHVVSVLPRTDIDKRSVTLETVVKNASGKEKIMLNVYAGDNIISREFAVSEDIAFSLDDMKLWSPSSPHLYRFDMTLFSGGEEIDEVSSYFAMRKISRKEDIAGRNRMALNNEILFQYGTLDQGWWPDGLHTPPSAEAMRYDMEVLKGLGFNTVRKHIKVEPALYYYYADSMGLLVWQDMPSGFPVPEWKEALVGPNSKDDWERPGESAHQWEEELKAMIDNMRFFPSIVSWVIFNEGWGQYDTKRIVEWAMDYDPERLINGVSGWTDRKVGHMYDLHNYPSASMEPMGNMQGRIQVLGEFGGLGLPLEGHLWNPDMRNWGYRNMDGGTALLNDYARLMFDLEPLIKAGLSAAIYTQTTDVEGEVNGLITYDREVVKLPKQFARILHDRLYRITPAEGTVLVTDSRIVENSKAVSVDDAPMENMKMPLRVGSGRKVRSEATFTLDHIPGTLSLYMDMRNKAKVWINGYPAADINDLRITGHYTHYNLSDYIDCLRVGENTVEIENVNNDNNSRFDYCLYAY